MTSISANWKQSGGNLLLLLAIAVCAVASLCFYLGWLPSLPLPSQPPSQFGTRSPRSGLLVVTTIIPSADRERDTHAVLWLLPATGRLHGDAVPNYSVQQLIPSNGVLTFVLPGVPIGLHTVLVFIDRNDNQRLDFGADGLPREPFRLSLAADGPIADQLSLSDAALSIDADEPSVVTLDFGAPVGIVRRPTQAE